MSILAFWGIIATRLALGIDLSDDSSFPNCPLYSSAVARNASSRALITVVGSDKDAMSGKFESIYDSYVADFIKLGGQGVFMTDSVNASWYNSTIVPNIACCPKHLGNLGINLNLAQQKLEHAVVTAYRNFPDKDWYVFTETDVWWNVRHLDTYLNSMDEMITANATFYPAGLIGGGVFKDFIAGPWVIFSRKAIEVYTEPKRMEFCKRIISSSANIW
jgi:hypothetical protein